MFFFFKQKTAYEMRISDWSSDVCSSDLQPCEETLARHLALGVKGLDRNGIERHRAVHGGAAVRLGDVQKLWPVHEVAHVGRQLAEVAQAVRSEEHTSELQSLMRISYAVFCLKKKLNLIAHRISTLLHSSNTSTALIPSYTLQ